MIKKQIDAALSNWTTLNDTLRDLDEDGCRKLLDAERRGKCRAQFLGRIHGRLNKTRLERERAELGVTK